MDDAAERVATIERSFVTHWSHFGRYPGAALHDEDGVLWYESPIAHLPYNAVIRTRIDGDAERVVAGVAARFRERGVPFMWVRRPSDTPDDLDALLRAQGLALVEEATGMDLDLDRWRPEPVPEGVTIVDGGSGDALRDYETLIRTYWSVPEDARELIERMNRHWAGDNSPGARYVAYAGDVPVGKLFLNLVDLPVIAVYGVAVVPEGRGRGVATALMNAAIAHGRDLGATRVVLHSSEMAHGMYVRMGFVPRCPFLAYATEPVFTHHH
jgi:GNAT superfamily N-acetyltransferase